MMGDRRAIITPVDDNVETKKNNFSLLKEDKILCGNCKKELVEILKVKENKLINIIQASCPFCGDGSFVYRITGKIYINSANGVSIADMPVEIKDNIISTKIKVVKNG